MSDAPEPSWSLRRFLWRAVPWVIACAVVWKFTFDQNDALTVAITKFLHRLVGLPAPYLFCDEKKFFWHATMFPPVVGLTLASYWVRWPDRVVRAAVGYVTHCCLTAIAIAVHESPYLMQTEMRNPVTSMLVNANYLMFGAVIWLLAAGPWYVLRRASSLKSGEGDGVVRVGRKERSLTVAARMGRRAWGVVRYGWVTRLVLLVLGVSLVLPLFALTGTPSGMSARLDMARALRDVPYFPHPPDAEVTVDPLLRDQRERYATKAILAFEAVLEADKRADVESAPVKYLLGKMLLSLKPPDPERRARFRAQGILWQREAFSTRGK